MMKEKRKAVMRFESSMTAGKQMSVGIYNVSTEAYLVNFVEQDWYEYTKDAPWDAYNWKETDRDDYRAFVDQFRTYYKTECSSANVDYVPMDTSVGFDKALLDYLILRQRRFG